MKNRELSYFFQHEEGRKIVEFFEFLVDTWDERDYYVFICRSSYWLFLILCAKYGWVVDESRILSDRYVVKEYATELEGKRVALIDDTMSTGYALYKVFSRLRQWYPGMYIEPMVVYCGVRKLNFSQISREPETERSLIDEFNSSIRYVTEASCETMGAFSFHVTGLVQRAMVPYVVELPFLVDRQYADRKYLSDLGQGAFADRVVVVADRVFKHLISTDSNWHYCDNSYNLPDGEKIHCGYFYYSGAELQGLFGDYLLRSIVKCRYEYIENNAVKALFTPFAVFQCIGYEEAKDIALSLYEGTAYENFLQAAQDRIYENLGKADEKFEVAVYRSIVYFVSEYLARMFSDYVSLLGIELVQNVNLMQNHASAVFISTVKEMIAWDQEEFLKRLFRVNLMQRSRSIRYFDRECFYRYEDQLRLSYQTLYNEVLRRKRQTQNVFSFTLEEMTEHLYRNVEFPSMEALKDCLVSSLLRMLDMSILGNMLEYDMGVIKRGFRYGENSDVMLPYYNPYVFFALELRYQQVERGCEQEDGDEKCNKILRFLDDFYFFLERKNYLDIIVNREDYMQIWDYCHVEWETMRKIILNKHFLLKEQSLMDIVCKEIKEYVQNMYIG
ncbi:MAG: hypothetical protein NC548_36130 [Lachnospiraceae bacterium]|nr:hypothetical protein [Lachnospiraceae bacterium]